MVGVFDSGESAGGGQALEEIDSFLTGLVWV